eukprot:2546207-Rhodomonas_salina.1
MRTLLVVPEGFGDGSGTVGPAAAAVGDEGGNSSTPGFDRRRMCDADTALCGLLSPFFASFSSLASLAPCPSSPDTPSPNARTGVSTLRLGVADTATVAPDTDSDIASSAAPPPAPAPSSSSVPKPCPLAVTSCCAFASSSSLDGKARRTPASAGFNLAGGVEPARSRSLTCLRVSGSASGGVRSSK